MGESVEKFIDVYHHFEICKYLVIEINLATLRILHKIITLEGNQLIRPRP